MNLKSLKVKQSLEFGLPVLLSFSLPLSTAVTTVSIILIWLVWWLGGNLKQKLIDYWQHPISPILLVILGLYGLACLYSAGSADQQLERLSDGAKLLLIPVLVYYFSDLKTARFALYAFILAMIITFFAAFSKMYLGSPIGVRIKYTDAAVFKNHIDTNFFMALASVYLAFLTPTLTAWRKGLAVALIMMMFYYVFFMSVGRIGYIAVFVFCTYYAYKKYDKKGLLIGGLTVLCLAFILYTFSEAFHQRIDVLSQDWLYYQKGRLIDSSLGSRLQFYHSSLLLMKEQWLLGWGTGAFSVAYDWLSQGAYLHTDNPHNEFLRIGVEFGLVGLFLFAWLFYKQWQCIQSMPQTWQALAKGTFIVFLVGCLFNSWLIDFTQTCFYVLFSGLTGAYVQALKPGDLVAVRLH